MKFSTKKDIEAPLDYVWAAMTDFEAWERAAMRRGADVTRTDSKRSPAAGMGWAAKFRYRGKDRTAEIQLTKMEAPAALCFAGQSAAISAEANVELMEMSAKRTRIHVTMEVTPRSLGARLFLQSLRLARARVDRKYETRIAQLALDIEQRYRQSQRRV